MTINQHAATSKKPVPATPTAKSNTGAKPKSKAKPKKKAKKNAVSPQLKPGETNVGGNKKRLQVAPPGSGYDQSEFFRVNDRDWEAYQDTIAGFGYHLAACNTGFARGGDIYRPQLRVSHTLDERGGLITAFKGDDACEELGYQVRNKMVASAIDTRFPAGGALTGMEVMLHEYTTLLAVTRDELRGEFSPSGYLLLLGLYAVRYGGWWSSPDSDDVEKSERVFPGYGQLVNFLWRVGPQVGSAGGFGYTAEEGRWELREALMPSSKRNSVLVELALMDACRIALAKTMRITNTNIDLQDVVLTEMHELLGSYSKRTYRD
jgi:hypothetical protein